MSTPRPARGRDAKNRHRISGAAAGRRRATSRVNVSVPVTTDRVAGLTSTATVLRLWAGGTIIDLKLWLMRSAIGRGIAALAAVLVAYSVLLIPDSTPPAKSTAGPASRIASVPATVTERDYYTTHQSIVPYGLRTLELPILMYHYIRVPPSRRVDMIGYNLSVAPAVFTAQMDWLQAHGYHTVTFDDMRRYWARVSPLPSKPVIITIDDGYQDLYSAAYPILAAHGFTAVAYIVSGFVGERGYVTAAEVVEMDRYGIEIGAHTVNHVDLAHSPEPWLTYQVEESKSWLENLLGHPVVDMAYPSGKFNALVVAAVERAGYWSAVTEVYSVLHTQADRYVWGRVRVAGGEPLAMFISELGPTMPTVTITRVVRISTANDLHHLG